MNQGDEIQPYLQGLVDLFLVRCTEKSTMGELKELLSNQDRWIEAHALFDRIRRKALGALKRKDGLLTNQYSFEEICAKTMFNLTHTHVPFDADSPFFVIPIAFSFARALGIADEEVMRIVAPRNPGSQISRTSVRPGAWTGAKIFLRHVSRFVFRFRRS